MNLITQTENSVICNSCNSEIFVNKVQDNPAYCKCNSVRLAFFKTHVQYSNLNEKKEDQRYHKLFQRT